MFKFGQVTVNSKEFNKAKRVTNILNIDYDKIMVSDAIACNNGKDRRYEIGYSLDGKITPLFIKTPKNVFSYGVSRYNENSAYTMSFIVDEHEEWRNHYRKIWETVESQIFNSLTTSPVKEDRYINTKLKCWKDKITSDFHGKSVPEDQHCEATAILKLSSVYQQGQNFYPQVFLEECKYQNVENKRCQFLSDSEDDYIIS